MNTLTAAQRQAAASSHPRILALAGPGSGKTLTLIERVRRLIGEGAAPAQIVAITYTNAAADEIAKRLTPLKLGYLGTIHGFALSLIQSHHHVLGFGARITVIDNAQKITLIEELMAQHRYTASRQSVEAEIGAGVPEMDRSPTKARLIAKDYYNYLGRNKVIDFDSILIVGAKLIQHMPEIHIGCECAKVEHLFVDELQDCSDLDWALFLGLPIANRFLVGDPDQSIFGFRGGRPDRVVSLATKEGWEVIHLEQNHRSQLEICVPAQKLIEHNKERVPKQTLSVRGPGGGFHVQACQEAGQEKNTLLTAINKMVADGIKPADMAVLLRTNYLVGEFTEFFRSVGIPVAERRRQPTPEDWPVAKILLALLANPDNDYIARQYVLTAFGKAKADEVTAKATEEFKTINALLWELPAKFTLVEAFVVLLRFKLGLQSLQLLRDAASRLCQTVGYDVALNDLVIAINDDLFYETIGEGVAISTIHGAKGLEWSVVFLPAFEQEIIPGIRKNLQIEEERRLAYVGMTRAKDCLIISHAALRKNQWSAGSLEHHPSQFIAEMSQ